MSEICELFIGNLEWFRGNTERNSLSSFSIPDDALYVDKTRAEVKEEEEVEESHVSFRFQYLRRGRKERAPELPKQNVCRMEIHLPICISQFCPS